MSELLSRGAVISLIAGIPAAVAFTADAAAADSAQVATEKKNISYTDKSTKAGQSCSNCSFFKATSGGNGTCPFVNGGTVKATGWCKNYHAK